MVLVVAAVIIGFNVFDEQGCQQNWFVEDENICKSCTVHFGDECLLCTDSSKCEECQVGFFWASEDDPQRGIIASSEIRCRTCQEQWGEFCEECT